MVIPHSYVEPLKLYEEVLYQNPEAFECFSPGNAVYSVAVLANKRLLLILSDHLLYYWRIDLEALFSCLDILFVVFLFWTKLIFRRINLCCQICYLQDSIGLQGFQFFSFF